MAAQFQVRPILAFIGFTMSALPPSAAMVSAAKQTDRASMKPLEVLARSLDPEIGRVRLTIDSPLA